MASKTIARLPADAPRSLGQWMLLVLSAGLPAAGYFGATYFERHPQPWIDVRPELSFAAGWAAAVILTITSLFRRVAWVLPALALNLMLLASGLLAPRFLRQEPVAWGGRGIHQFAVLSDRSVLVCGAEWVLLGPDAAFQKSLHEPCGYADLVQPFADGRTVLGLYGRPMLGDAHKRFREIDWLPPEFRYLRGAVATPEGGTILATVSSGSAAPHLWQYGAGQRLERSWALQPPAHAWAGAPLGWSIAPFPDGSAAVLWRDGTDLQTSFVSWHLPDGRPRPETVRDFCSGCTDPQLLSGRSGLIYARGSGSAGISLLRVTGEGGLDASFRPDAPALTEALKNVISLAKLAEGGVLVGGLKRVVKLDDAGHTDPGFQCTLENSARQLALQGDAFLVLDGDRLRRFHQDGSEDASWRMPRLSTRLTGPPQTKPD